MAIKSNYVHKPEEMPSGEHWAIIQGSSVFIPGDERSKQSPGHGYPERTEHYITYEVFTDETEFQAELQRRLEYAAKQSFGRKEIRGIHVAATYSGRTQINLEVTKTK